ncbi:subunit 11 of the general transcription factor TFIIH domain-containing protein [Trichoderma breve]|uniref:Subunit 11 of the general transcription factor TFIIH domain-containing protein n=1 Tax=Trichoderma breve TaxID=2034170 RepID=A0A9W9BFH2_9HYPO|nr:subunit 11 of the general transcription factor TFIIH domain-containing protein [Trichoderma breve]KAJ4861512.1 subunit 11 of the general transcription factor TFIIH domain-containing protein [Trichoderma breve]
MTDSPRQPGGFIPPQGGLPSPAPSSASSRAASNLPHPRNSALRPGSNKEDMVRRFVDEKLLYVSRRYVKKFGNPNPGDTVVGFRTFGEVCRELDEIVNVLWKSGTPGLQIPFLLKLASDFTQYVRSFPPSSKASFDLLHKLDHCFASLLSGQDIETNETLPGFENGLRAGMTTTDMVRCRSLVEQTRVLMVEVMSSGEQEEEEDDDEDDDEDDGDETETGESYDAGGPSWDIDEDELHLDAARIYENTIVHLGKRLGDSLGNSVDSGEAGMSSTSTGMT